MEKRRIRPGPSRAQLLRYLARLESINDHLQTEMTSLDSLLRAIGFTEGVATLKAAAHECLATD